MTMEEYIKEIDERCLKPMKAMLEQSIEREEKWREIAERANDAERKTLSTLREQQVDETRRRFRASLMMEWIQKDGVPVEYFPNAQMLDSAERWADGVLERCFGKKTE